MLNKKGMEELQEKLNKKWNSRKNASDRLHKPMQENIKKVMAVRIIKKQ